MKVSVTVDELIAAFAEKVRSMPSTKPRDPVERDLLRKLGDPNVGREQDQFVRVAGERPTAANSKNCDEPASPANGIQSSNKPLPTPGFGPSNGQQ